MTADEPPGLIEGRMIRGVLVCAMLACGVDIVPAQLLEGSFGPTVLRSLPVRVNEIVHGETGADGEQRLVVLTPGFAGMTVLQVPGNAGITISDSISIPYPFRIIPFGVAPHHLHDRMYVLRSDSLVLTELIRDAQRGWISNGRVSLDRTPRAVYSDDLNGDGTEDLILVSEEEPGLLPLYRNLSGALRRGKVIAPDLLVRSVAPLHLNDDGIRDILAYDWVHSELHLIYGVGRERFLDQGGLPVDGTVDAMFVDPETDLHPLRVTLFDESMPQLTFLEMDERGDLIEVSKLLLSTSIRHVYAVHDDSTFRSLFVLLADSSIGLIRDAFIAQTPTVAFSGLAGRVTSAWSSEDGSVTMVLDSTTYCRIWQYGSRWPGTDSLVLAAPMEPAAVVVRDQNGDGHEDVTLFSGRTGEISLVWGHSNGSFSGAENFAGPEAPVTAVGQSYDDTLSRFYTTHSDPQSIGVTEVDWRDFAVTTLRIPVPGSTELIGEIRDARGVVSLSAIHRSSDSSATFASYERIRQDQFLEQTLNLGAPAVLFGASVDYVDDDSIPDAILIYRPDDSSAVALNVSYGDTSAHLRRPAVGSILPVADPRIAYVWQADVNGDSLQDVVSFFPKSVKEVYCMMSTSDSLYNRIERIDSAVSVEHRQDVAVFDADSDGLPDLFAIVRDRGGLGWWHNTGQGTFAQWELLVSAPDLSGFGFGHLYGPEGFDLVVTRRKMNAAVIYSRTRMPWGAE